MKVKFRNISQIEEDKWILSEHLVLAYGVWDENTRIFLIADRALNIIEPSDDGLEVVEDNLSDYENFPALNYNKDFYVQKDFLKRVKNFETYHDFKWEKIWIKCKLNSFFYENDFEFPITYTETVQNENYKLGIIEGFLLFTNHFINNNNKGSSYRNNFYFNKSESLESIIPVRFKDSQHYKFSTLDVHNYETDLLDFITEKLYFNEPKEVERDKYLIRDFFELIDSIFIDSIQEVYKIKTFYDDMFVVKYDNKFYYLNYDWTS